MDKIRRENTREKRVIPWVQTWDMQQPMAKCRSRTERGRYGNMRDRGLTEIGDLLLKVMEEDHNQIDKWGYQDHPPEKWLVILIEEIGELARAILECGTAEQIQREAIQGATLCLKIANMSGAEIHD
ncbi:MAG: hypothetical protein QME66_04580 [Candidatus Eisenbacteria bacterium]|nr:hypothetical protein [Candidatus Eisenbacteria bacterium]